MQYRRVEFRQIGWRQKIGLVVAVALGLGLVAAFVVLALGVALLLLPVVAIASAIGWIRWRKAMAAAADKARAADDGRIIETEYRVLDGRSRP